MKKMTKKELRKRFENEMIDRKKLNYLIGGDGNGGQGANDDPWD